MAKSTWKFFKTNRKELRLYAKEMKLLREKKSLQYYGLENNTLRLNTINWMHNYFFYLGNSFIKKLFFCECINMPVKRFLKFKKPFNYKSKKKKKINVNK